jgi:hypothetical protein
LVPSPFRSWSCRRARLWMAAYSARRTMKAPTIWHSLRRARASGEGVQACEPGKAQRPWPWCDDEFDCWSDLASSSQPQAQPDCNVQSLRHPDVSASPSGWRAATTSTRFAASPHRGLQQVACRGRARTRKIQQQSCQRQQQASSRRPNLEGFEGFLPADLLAQTRFHQLISVDPRKRPAIGPPAALLPFLGCMQLLQVRCWTQHAGKGSRRAACPRPYQL